MVEVFYTWFDINTGHDVQTSVTVSRDFLLETLGLDESDLEEWLDDYTSEESREVVEAAMEEGLIPEEDFINYGY